MTNQGQKLKLKARAERQSQTRRRITAAAVELHQAVGPLATTISAIAERAGVERLTVYRHFPDEASLFAACTRHYFDSHPPPLPSKWESLQDPLDRFSEGLKELYAYWDQNQHLISSILRDYEVAPERIGSGTVEYIEEASQVLSTGWDLGGTQKRLLKAAIAHAVHFYTWRSLVRDQRLSATRAVDLMVELVRANTNTDH